MVYAVRDAGCRSHLVVCGKRRCACVALSPREGRRGGKGGREGGTWQRLCSVTFVLVRFFVLGSLECDAWEIVGNLLTAYAEGAYNVFL